MTMRIIHVNVARGFRGGERQTELLIRELARQDIEQILVARAGEPLLEHVADLHLATRAVSGSAWSVAEATREADIVHVHEGRSVYGAYFRNLLSSTPYVVTRRVDNPIRPHWLARRAYGAAAAVAAISPQVRDVVLALDPTLRVPVIHSSAGRFTVDEARAAAIRSARRGKFIVGNVAALDVAQKCQDQIIRVARELQASDPDIVFVLVGGGADEARLKEAARGLDNLEFAGFVDDVGSFLAAFDLFILPSRREGLGSTLLDAMERGLPIVASRVGGVPEIVHDGENGLLIDPERPDQLKAAILRLRAAKALRRKLGECGRRIAAGYTPGAMAAHYMDLYRTTLAEAGPSLAGH
jgi:glycosyltransferase involved in cell wall biosynthesis